ncbi:MAG: four helix bundle protein [Pirellulales bacterium]|nr:four helix bundle protein [Pirellulales bacterium]
MRKDEDLCDRTKKFALRIIWMYDQLPSTTTAQTIGKQVLRSGTSAAANYREARRGRSRAEVRAKLGLVEQELDETMLWLELLVDAEIVSAPKLAPLLQEADELIRIIATSITQLREPRTK